MGTLASAPSLFAASSKERAIAVIAGGGIFVHLILRFGPQPALNIQHFPLFVVLGLGGLPLLLDLLKRVQRLEFGSDILAGISIVAAAIQGEYLVGAIIVLMLSGGTALEQYALDRANVVLRLLASRLPTTVHKKIGEEILDSSLETVTIGEQVVVFPHETCPVDGIVVTGQSAMDESYLTGEPYHIAKVVGSTVLSGTINGEGALTVQVSSPPTDSRFARILRVLEEAERSRPPMRRLADRLGAWYTLFALAIAVLGWLASGESQRFLAVLVIATPCPLLLAIPVAIMGAVSLAARRGIIIRRPAMLEEVSKCRTFIFDKTGTLTYGTPLLTEILFARETESTALQLAASLEQFSKHPLAHPILQAAKAANLALLPVSEVSEAPGQGLRGRVSAYEVQIINRALLQKLSVQQLQVVPAQQAGLECLLLINGQYSALFRFRDEPRKESRAFIGHLKPRHSAKKVILLSGDRESEVAYMAQKVGISEMFHGKSPEEKLLLVQQEVAREPTIFIGDGINDAPAMQAATVGIAVGPGSDVTAEAADAVILDASLSKVDEVFHIGSRLRTIALQSAIGGMACSIIGMALAAGGYLSPLIGAVTQEAIDLAAVLNALRVSLTTRKLHEL